MDIKAKFLELTTKTYPKGTEKETYQFLSDEFIKDQFDNLSYTIGNPDTMFCAHLDTVGEKSDVVHVIEGDIIKTNGKTILGADDKAGVVIMLYMIENNIPGFYLFTVGEEKGCEGSSRLSQQYQTNKDPNSAIANKFKGIKKIIAFDRSGYSSVITHQLEQRCCSDQFANALINELGKNGLPYTIDVGGVYCDSAEFADLFPECTNISVGYFDQHNVAERQDIGFLQRLADACCRIDWKSLPVVRDPKKIEYVDSYYFSKRKKKRSDEEESEFDDYDFHPFAIDDNKNVEIYYFEDKKFNHISDISYLNGEIIDITLSRKRIQYELDVICDYLIDSDIIYDFVTWDGLILVVEHDKQETKVSRNELLQFIPELDLENLKKKSK